MLAKFLQLLELLQAASRLRARAERKELEAIELIGEIVDDLPPGAVEE